MSTKTKQCPYCAEQIAAEAIKCRFCGEFLDDQTRRKRHHESKARIPSPFSAGLLAVLSPGAGQAYNGEYGKAAGVIFAWVFVAFIVGGIRQQMGASLIITLLLTSLVFVIAILDAIKTAGTQQRGETEWSGGGYGPGLTVVVLSLIVGCVSVLAVLGGQ